MALLLKWPRSRNFQFRFHFLSNMYLVIAMLMFFTAPLRAESFETQQIKVGIKSIKVEVAKTPTQRSQGLMFRKSFSTADGMLFIFDSEQPLSFWMKNTFIDLSIGFFDRGKKLVDIQDMQSVKSEMETNLPSYSSKVPALYALEVPKGWFEKHKIKIGDKLVLSSGH